MGGLESWLECLQIIFLPLKMASQKRKIFGWMNPTFHVIIFIILSISVQNHIVNGEFPKWHNLAERLKFKKNAESLYSPTMKIMVNQLWPRTELKDEKKFPRLREVDMDLTPAQWKRYSIYGFYFDNKMDIIPDPWPSGTIKYRWSSSEAVKDKTVVVLAMKEWTTRTKCIKFVEDTSSPEKNVLHIVGRKIAFASVGYRKERKQHVLSLPGYAMDKSLIIHMLGHVLGLPHSHSRPDRDRFIRFMKQNIELEDVKFLNYRHDCPYDYSSVMHFDAYAFTMASTGEISYEPKSIPWSPHKNLDEYLRENYPKAEPRRLYYTIGRWLAPSWTDIFHVENAYKCERAASCYPTALSVYKEDGVQQYPLPADLRWSLLLKYSIFLREGEHLNDFTFNINRVAETYALDILMTYTSDTITDDDACHRMVVFVQLTQRPTREQMAYWLLTGCTWFQIDIYDRRFNFHEVVCAADFARNHRKALFTSLNVRGYVRMIKTEDPIAKSMKDGIVSAMGFVDYICTGQVLTDPPCQGVEESNKQREFWF